MAHSPSAQRKDFPAARGGDTKTRAHHPRDPENPEQPADNPESPDDFPSESARGKIDGSSGQSGTIAPRGPEDL